MIPIILLVVFVLGYIAIALEHKIHVDKAASALITGTVCWAIFVLGYNVLPEHLKIDFAEFLSSHDHGLLSTFYEHRLLHHMEEIASILFFLLGAMTIVELVDAHEGFRVITDKIKTNNKVKLLWIICILSFFFSS
jgi:Na+/H+ antiporter NhaD/arsenite permease-like protein